MIDKLIVAVIACAGVFLVLIIADIVSAKPSNAFQVRVVEKSYTPSQTTTGVGIGSGSNGKSSTVVTTSTTSERWSLICEYDGEIMVVDSNSKMWASAKSGDYIYAAKRVGRILGVEYGVKQAHGE